MPLFGHSKKGDKEPDEDKIPHRETSLTASKMNRMAFNAEDPECDTIRAMVTSPVSIEYERLKESKPSVRECDFQDLEDERREKESSTLPIRTHLSSPLVGIDGAHRHCDVHREPDILSGKKESLASTTEAVKSVATDKLDTMGETTERLWENAKEKANDVKDMVKDKIDDAKDALQQKSQIHDQDQRAPLSSRDDERIEEERSRDREILLHGDPHRVYVQPSMNAPNLSSPSQSSPQKRRRKEQEDDVEQDRSMETERVDVDFITAKNGPIAFNAEDPEVDAMRTFRGLWHRFSG